MRIERHDDPRAFFDRVGPFLAAREAEHNLLLGFRTALIADRHAFGPTDPYLAAALDGEEVVGVAVRTPPHNLVLSLMDDATAAAFAGAIDLEEVPGLSAPVGVGEAFLRHSTGAATVAVRQRVFRATDVLPPRSAPGGMRPAGADDDALLVEWLVAFGEEALGAATVAEAEEVVERRFADPHGGFLLWEDGAAVSFLGYGSPTPNGIRIGPVYTPPELRGRGYASALTAAATQRLLASGRRFCFLSTDLANPTSNAIYQRIGYRPVLDVNVWRFAR